MIDPRRRVVEALRSAIAPHLEAWPSHHHDLRRRVAREAERLPAGSVVCALEGYYLPHGGRDEVWITVTPGHATVRRVRTPDSEPPMEVVRLLDGGEAQGVIETLSQLGVWSLGPCKRSSTDGWPCAIAITDGARLHSIQTHNPHGPHLRLMGYVLSLIDVPEEASGRMWALTTARGEVIVGIPPWDDWEA